MSPSCLLFVYIVNRRVDILKTGCRHVFTHVALRLTLTGWAPAVTARQQQPTAAATQPVDAALDVVELRPNLFLIGGAGGNIAVQIGSAGVIVVDSGTTEAADRVVAAIKRLPPRPIRYVINTGMDADHVGGNETLSKAGLSTLPGAVAAGAGLGDALLNNGGAASVLAHENVLTRMSARRQFHPKILQCGEANTRQDVCTTPMDGVPPIVDQQSPAELKIRLFRSLFRGREDVHPRHFESRQTGRSCPRT